MTDSFDRFTRQAELVPADKLSQLDMTVIGVGAIGRQVALQLASLGARKLQLVDFDVVEASNTTTQGFLQTDLGLPKVEAAARSVRQIDPRIEIELVADRFRPQLTVGDVVFCCVDSISAREAIWRSAGQRCRFWCDGRMLGEVMRILTAACDRSRSYYPTSLFQQSEAQGGSCTSRGTIYTAAIAAGLMTHQLTRWLRGAQIEADLSLNLLAAEMSAM